MKAPTLFETLPVCDRQRATPRDPHSVVACVTFREAVRQWGADLVPSGSYDVRGTVGVSLRDQTRAETGAMQPLLAHSSRRWLRASFGTFGPVVSGPLDAEPVLAELAAWDEFQQSKRWSSRDGAREGDRVLTVEGVYRGDPVDFNHVVSPENLVRWSDPRFALERVTANMDRVIDYTVLARLLGREVLELLGER